MPGVLSDVTGANDLGISGIMNRVWLEDTILKNIIADQFDCTDMIISGRGRIL